LPTRNRCEPVWVVVKGSLGGGIAVHGSRERGSNAVRVLTDHVDVDPERDRRIGMTEPFRDRGRADRLFPTPGPSASDGPVVPDADAAGV
jgi:hypothetical protein